MNFERIRPGPALAPFVEWYWAVESDDPTPRIQKIVPDGYPEFIFHYADPFRIRLNDRWSTQGRALVGGQMLKHFFLENTGVTEMFGITFKPAAITHLLHISMRPLTGKVIDLSELPRTVSRMADAVGSCKTMSDRITVAETYLKPLITKVPEQHVVDRSLAILREHAGLIPIPKYYSRIIRFSTIFTQMKEGKVSWADVIHASGYYDQSHFIRDFKAFTGEDPSGFQFQEPSLTNFFAGKKRMSDLSNTNRKASA